MQLEVSHSHARRLAKFLREQSTILRTPIFVALDGRSGSGKSTIATLVADELNSDCSGKKLVTVIEGDQFYGGGSAPTWDGMSMSQKIDRVIDWRRQQQLLKSLRHQGAAVWSPFDWDSEDWDADTIPLNSEPIRCVATPIVLLEGAYSARPELADLLDVRVLLEIPKSVRRSWLLEREGEAYRDDWEGRWSEAEDHYFGSIVPASGFDLVLVSSDEGS